MNTTDFERVLSQTRRVLRKHDDIRDTATTLSDEGVDTTQSTSLDTKQREFQEETVQLIADLKDVLETSDAIELEREYVAPNDSFTISHLRTAEIEITYHGENDLDASKVTVYRNDTETGTQFSGTISTDDYLTIDTAVLADGDSITVEWTDDIETVSQLGLPGNNVPLSVDAGPDHDIPSSKLRTARMHHIEFDFHSPE